MEIGTEIVATLEILRDWKVPVEDVRLYKGTPTCFGIKADKKMILNPYPYGSVAFDSPCLLVESVEGASGYFYDAFERAHFRSPWDTLVAGPISDYDQTISDLKDSLSDYAETVKGLLD